ncbi:DNA polymerase lambda, partial [Stegodyphus mimosarum]
MSIIFGLYSFVQCDACSSLRRNRQFCGHIEILVSLPEGHVNDHKILPEIVAKLHQDGYLIDDLLRHEENGAQTRYVGIIKLTTAGAKYRRISITVCNREEYACALMYLTGSAYFNKAVRQVAFKKNMILDEHSLRKKTVTEDRELVYEVLATPSEADIFLHLNIPFRVPEI